MPDPITHADQVTQDWLSGVLQRGGYLPRGAIAAFEKTLSQPFLALTVWIRAAYDRAAPPDLPTAFVLKIGEPDSPAGEREVQFYRDFAAAHPRTIAPPCFDAAYDADRGAYHVLLADLSATHYVMEREAPPTPAEAGRMVDALAALHAFWWDRLPPSVQPVDPDLLAGAPIDPAGFFGFLGERLSAGRRRFYERAVERLPGLLRRRLADGRGQTLVHDDPHAWNFLHPQGPGGAVLLDWQQWGRSIGVHDLAYAISLFWYPELRRRLEAAMVARYHAGLVAGGVTGYSRDQCWQDYRLYVLRSLMVPLWAWRTGRWAPHRWAQIEKCLLACDELACDELLEAPDRGAPDREAPDRPRPIGSQAGSAG